MSAYICNPAHFAALAVFAVDRDSAIHEWRDSSPLETAKNVARGLALENIRSVTNLYPNDGDGNRPGYTGTDAEIVAEAEALTEVYLYDIERRSLPPVAILKMCNCYDYQSCETADWCDTQAHCQIDWIADAAVAELPGYDAAPWEYDGGVTKTA